MVRAPVFSADRRILRGRKRKREGPSGVLSFFYHRLCLKTLSGVLENAFRQIWLWCPPYSAKTSASSAMASGRAAGSSPP